MLPCLVMCLCCLVSCYVFVIYKMTRATVMLLFWLFTFAKTQTFRFRKYPGSLSSPCPQPHTIYLHYTNVQLIHFKNKCNVPYRFLPSFFFLCFPCFLLPSFIPSFHLLLSFFLSFLLTFFLSCFLILPFYILVLALNNKIVIYLHFV